MFDSNDVCYNFALPKKRLQATTITMSVLKKPLLTEKYAAISEKLGQYAFIVEKKATKEQIKKEIGKIYDVHVSGVRTMIYAGKQKNRMTKRRIVEGRTPAFKKAIVTLKAGDKIDFYGNL